VTVLPRCQLALVLVLLLLCFVRVCKVADVTHDSGVKRLKPLLLLLAVLLLLLLQLLLWPCQLACRSWVCKCQPGQFGSQFLLQGTSNNHNTAQTHMSKTFEHGAATQRLHSDLQQLSGDRPACLHEQNRRCCP
jgi:hypothetical protein